MGKNCLPRITFAKGGAKVSPLQAWWAIGLLLLLLASCAQVGVQQAEGIPRVSVSSSALRSVGYDNDRAILEIKFHNGAVYDYYDVPPDVHRGLMSAESHGRYFHQHIREAGYKYKRIE